jgi:hypothetical protein
MSDGDRDRRMGARLSRLAKLILIAVGLCDPWPCPLCGCRLNVDRPWRAQMLDQVAAAQAHLKTLCPIILAPFRETHEH